MRRECKHSRAIRILRIKDPVNDLRVKYCVSCEKYVVWTHGVQILKTYARMPEITIFSNQRLLIDGA